MDRSISIEEPCVCGNRRDDKYRLYETEGGEKIFGKQCVMCEKEWLPQDYLPNMVAGMRELHIGDSSFLYQRYRMTSQIIVTRSKIGDDFDSLLPGNHVTWRSLYGYWHHAIVAKMDDYGIGAIHWTHVGDGQIEITKQYLPIDEDQNSLYLLNYPEEIEKNNDINLVLGRAYSRTGDKKHGKLTENSELFATFCKTGCEISHKDDIRVADPCDCGNNDPVKFRQYRDKQGELLGKRCNNCKTEWLIPRNGNSDTTDGAIADGFNCLFKRKPPELEENTALKINACRTPIDEGKLGTLRPGDHISWERTLGHLHHAIVVQVVNATTPADAKIVVINWTKTASILCGFNSITIVQETLSAAENLNSLFRVNYSQEITRENDPKLVLARARSRVGDTGYGLADNCESFASYCKTGVEMCRQAAWLQQKKDEILGNVSVTFVKDLVKQVMGSISATARKAAADEVTEEMMSFFWKKVVLRVVDVLKRAIPEMSDDTAIELIRRYMGKVAVAETFETLKKASDWVGAGLVVIFELYSCIRDVTRTYRDKKTGKMSRRDWIKESTQRISEGVFSAIVTNFGSILGSCTPLGPFFGSIIGGAIGSFVGKYVGGSVIGSFIGRKVALQFHDDKIVHTIGDLLPGAHISFKYDKCPNKMCHAIFIEQDNDDHIEVIRETHGQGVKKGTLRFSEQREVRVVEDGNVTCNIPDKVVLYATLKTFEECNYSSREYGCKIFAVECKTRAKLL